MGVAMHQDRAVVGTHGRIHGIAVHVGQHGRALLLLGTLLAQRLCQRNALGHAARQQRSLPGRLAALGTPLLIGHVVGAQRVAMREQHPLATDLHHGGIGEQRGAAALTVGGVPGLAGQR